MSRFRLWGTVLLVPALTAVLAVVGCGGGDKDKKSSTTTTGGGGGGVEESKEVEGKKHDGAMSAVKATGYTATLKGKVTFDGTPPARKDLSETINQQADKGWCHSEAAVKAGDTLDPTWIVDPASKGVANVVVWLRAPEGQYFELPKDQREQKEPVIMDQPFCAFHPHVVAVNPTYYDPASKRQKETGQKLKVLNDASILHNTKAESKNNAPVNQPIPAKDKTTGDVKFLELSLQAGKDKEAGGEELLSIGCDVHKWMSAKAALFDHPYCARTKEDGTYEIKNAPVGAEVFVVYWHETFGDSLKKDGKADKITLKDGANTKDFTIKP